MAEKEKTVYDLDLHETLVVQNSVKGNMEITRVPGGWLYAMEYPGFRQSPVTFVPWNNGFQGIISKPKNAKYEREQDTQEGPGEEDAK